MDGNGLSKRSVPEHLSSGLRASAGSEEDLKGKRGVTASSGGAKPKNREAIPSKSKKPRKLKDVWTEGK